MSITAVVTNHNYARYLPECLESALRFCDEVLVYDDGSTDDSLEVLSRYPVKVTHREDATGSPVWGSNLGIEQATCDRLIFLDADNYLISAPPVRDVDYTFAAIEIVNDAGVRIDLWQYPTWHLTAPECLAKYKADNGMPFPWGGVWRTEFLRGKTWQHWLSTQYAADFRTAVDWCQDQPSLSYAYTPFLAFRVHAGQWSESPERAVMEADARALAATL